MKIKKISVTNVTSYNEKTTFDFDDGLNILIGPNGGGKSNLQKILAVILSHFFFRQYDFQDNNNETTIKPVDLWGRRQLQGKLDRFFGNEGNQRIFLEIVPEEADLANIRLIENNLDELNKVREYWEQPAETYPPFDFVDRIQNSNTLKYTVENFELQLEADTPEWAFREYLRTFNLFKRFASRLPQITLTSPVFFFSSERSFNREQQFQTQQLTEQNRFANERQAYQAAMGDNTDLFQLGATHFLRLYRKHERTASLEQGKTVFELVRGERDVKLLDKYLRKLGYDWNFETDEEGIGYFFVLKKGEHFITPNKFSSGEKEIVHFLLASFALNVRSGVVLIDEPELHLHPRWQRILLNLFEDLAADRENQFVITTHSPVFVSPTTINSVTRIYTNAAGASQRVALKEVNLPDKRALIRMINSQNNERIFFADKVILVEGIKDRLVFSSLIESAAARYSDNQSIEVIEVGGKHNFEFYSDLLNALETPSYIIADLDFIEQVGSTDVKKLFVNDDSSAWKALKDKKSTDAASLRKYLREAINVGKIEELRKFSAFLETRHCCLKDDLSTENLDLLKLELKKLQQENIWILSEGEIEHYLPSDSTQLDKIIATLEDRDWLLKIDSENRGELIKIICGILEIGLQEQQSLIDDFDAGNRLFSKPQMQIN